MIYQLKTSIYFGDFPWQTVSHNQRVYVYISQKADHFGGIPNILSFWDSPNMDVGQNGRPRGPQIEMSSLVLTIQLLGYLILTHTPQKINIPHYHIPSFSSSPRPVDPETAEFLPPGLKVNVKTGGATVTWLFFQSGKPM